MIAQRCREILLVVPALLLTCLVTAPATAQEMGMMMEHHPPRSIDVTGVGEYEVAPDRARLNFAVETRAPTAQAAAAQNAETMDQVINALVAAGVLQDDIETKNYSVHPEYVHDAGADEPRVSGYRVMNQVVVTTGDLDRVGALIDAALAAGSNRVDGVSFFLEDAQAAQSEALRRAVASARATAQTIAGALGVQLGPVLTASTSTEIPRPYGIAMAPDIMMRESAAMPTPIQPGEQTVTARVAISFSIAGG